MSILLSFIVGSPYIVPDLRVASMPPCPLLKRRGKVALCPLASR
jgi:hypothetical protein